MIDAHTLDKIRALLWRRDNGLMNSVDKSQLENYMLVYATDFMEAYDELARTADTRRTA